VRRSLWPGAVAVSPPGTAAVRAGPCPRVVCPLGAAAARLRVAELLRMPRGPADGEKKPEQHKFTRPSASARLPDSTGAGLPWPRGAQGPLRTAGLVPRSGQRGASSSSRFMAVAGRLSWCCSEFLVMLYCLQGWVFLTLNVSLFDRSSPFLNVLT